MSLPTFPFSTNLLRLNYQFLRHQRKDVAKKTIIKQTVKLYFQPQNYVIVLSVCLFVGCDTTIYRKRARYTKKLTLPLLFR